MTTPQTPPTGYTPPSPPSSPDDGALIAATIGELKLFGEPLKRFRELRAAHPTIDDGFKVVGVRFEKRHLAIRAEVEAAAREKRDVQATLELDPNNPWDKHAVCVLMGGRTVGYVSRDHNQRVGASLPRAVHVVAASDGSDSRKGYPYVWFVTAPVQ